MSPTCASSRTADGRVAVISTAVMVSTPFTLRTKAGLRHTPAQGITAVGRSASGNIRHRLVAAGEGLVQRKFKVRVSVCQGLAGTAAERADFGPDYQSPFHASLRPRRSRTCTRDTQGEEAFLATARVARSPLS